MSNVFVDKSLLSSAEFIWDPTKETGVYVRVNCISTEFTAKKHGGEKGVPFRIQVETYSHNEEESELLHCASCQIKVFKVSKYLKLLHCASCQIKVFKVCKYLKLLHRQMKSF